MLVIATEAQISDFFNAGRNFDFFEGCAHRKCFVPDAIEDTSAGKSDATERRTTGETTFGQLFAVLGNENGLNSVTKPGIKLQEFRHCQFSRFMIQLHTNAYFVVTIMLHGNQ